MGEKILEIEEEGIDRFEMRKREGFLPDGYETVSVVTIYSKCGFMQFIFEMFFKKNKTARSLALCPTSFPGSFQPMQLRCYVLDGCLLVLKIFSPGWAEGGGHGVGSGSSGWVEPGIGGIFLAAWVAVCF